MTQATRRERVRTDTERDIRRTARRLLVKDGQQAVTLRAIARELGITAPALYRYYSSREDLVEHLRTDVCDDLAAELGEAIAEVAGDPIAQVFAVCHGFRRWALAHPQEFTLVFASPAEPTVNCPVGGGDLAEDSFGRIFMSVAGQVLATIEVAREVEPDIPEALLPDLAEFRANLLSTMADTGITVPEDRLSVSTAYLMLQFWIRLYGQVALEVFGQFPFQISNAGPLFDSMIGDLAREVGLII